VEFARKYLSPITGKPIIDHVFLSTDLPITPIPETKPPQVNTLAAKISEKGSGAGITDGVNGIDSDVDEEDHVPIGDHKWEWAKVRAAEWLIDAGLAGNQGVDRVVEATGSEDCGLLGVALAKQGANCERSC
jgi:D-xylulose reductase